MTTPASPNPISMQNIINEFGANYTTNELPNRSSLGKYRVNQLIAGRNWPLDDGVPTQGPIKFSDLHGKTLNVVVDYSGNTQYAVVSSAAYDDRGTVVGGFRTRPASNSNDSKKVYHMIRTTIASTGSSIAAISPTSPSIYKPTRSTWYFNPHTPNTLGDFVSSVAVLPTYETVGYGRGSYLKAVPPKVDSTPTITSSGVLGSDAKFSFTKTSFQQITTRTTYYYYGKGGSGATTSYTRDSITRYSVNLVNGGSSYTRGGSVSVTWPGERTFTFTITDATPLPAFSTGLWGTYTTLFYNIVNGGKIYGTGGQGGSGGSSGGGNGGNGGPGGDAFIVQANCTIKIERGGELRAGGGGGGGGGGWGHSYGGPGGHNVSYGGQPGANGRGYNNISGSLSGSRSAVIRKGSSTSGNGGNWGQNGSNGTSASATGTVCYTFFGCESESTGSGGQGGAGGTGVVNQSPYVATVIQEPGSIFDN